MAQCITLGLVYMIAWVQIPGLKKKNHPLCSDDLPLDV